MYFILSCEHAGQCKTVFAVCMCKVKMFVFFMSSVIKRNVKYISSDFFYDYNYFFYLFFII